MCSIPTNSHNKTFAGFPRQVRKKHYLDSVKAHFLSMPSYRRMPGDDEFRREFERRDLYNFKNATYWLRKLENHGRKERVPVEEYTIEHILPQNENLSSAWKEALGPEWKRISDTYLHTLGNLTLTGYDSEHRDKEFSLKRTIPGGFAELPLSTNQGLAAIPVWNEEAIQSRAERISKEACKVWCRPSLPPHVIEAFRKGTPAAETTSTTAAGLPSSIAGLLDKLRERAKALDPTVVEESDGASLYFRADEKIATVIADEEGLRIIPPMPHVEVQDLCGICSAADAGASAGEAGTEFRLAVPEDLESLPGSCGKHLSGRCLPGSLHE